MQAYEPATQLAGVQFIYDAQGLTWQHIRQFDYIKAAKMVEWFLVGRSWEREKKKAFSRWTKCKREFFQTSAPVKYEGIHIVNQPLIFRALFSLFKPFMTEELRSKVRSMYSLKVGFISLSGPEIPTWSKNGASSIRHISWSFFEWTSFPDRPQSISKQLFRETNSLTIGYLLS